MSESDRVWLIGHGVGKYESVLAAADIPWDLVERVLRMEREIAMVPA